VSHHIIFITGVLKMSPPAWTQARRHCDTLQQHIQ